MTYLFLAKLFHVAQNPFSHSIIQSDLLNSSKELLDIVLIRPRSMNKVHNRINLPKGRKEKINSIPNPHETSCSYMDTFVVWPPDTVEIWEHEVRERKQPSWLIHFQRLCLNHSGCSKKNLLKDHILLWNESKTKYQLESNFLKGQIRRNLQLMIIGYMLTSFLRNVEIYGEDINLIYQP